ncbi:50S ribosomal protein L13 [Candidatus Bathyarchaeota archaeon]|nr:50S ribosomal protein L13 [Candidatus Bathyarchaeota archaeon]
MSKHEENIVIFDAAGLILGRVASVAARLLQAGKTVVVINAEKSVISGRPKSVIKAAKEFLEVKGRADPRSGPFHPRRPDEIVRRTIRGMLPWDKPKGKTAYRRLRVYIGFPEELKKGRVETIQDASATKLRCPFITVGELAKELGWKPVGE